MSPPFSIPNTALRAIVKSTLKKRVMVAATPESAPVAMRALQGHYEAHICTSLAMARGILAERVDAILCGIYFAESKMFDLLHLVKANEQNKSAPFLCVKANEGILSPVLLQSIEMASKTLGADSFVDLSEWRKTLGDEAAYARLQQMIDRLIDRQPCTE